MTNAAGRGSGPHCPQAAGPRPRSRRFYVRDHAGPDPQRCRPPARRVSGHAAALGQGRDHPARQRPLDAGRGRARPDRRAPARARVLARAAARGGALGPARLRLPGGSVPAASADAHARGGGGGDRSRARADRADLDRRRASRPESLERIGEEDMQLLRYMAEVLDAGFPLVAFLQVVRVYGQALAQIADAEVKLFHLFVHEPLMRDGVPGLEIAEEMEGLAAQLLPLASPIMDRLHHRALQHFLGQDVVGHLELEGAGDELGRLRVAIAFADLAGYTRLTEEAGEEEAVDIVERFVESVEVDAPRRRARDQDDRRRGDGRRRRRGRAGRLGRRLPGAERRAAAAAADRDPQRRRAVSRRRLLRAGGEPGVARRRAGGRRRGARDARGRGARPATTWRSSRSARSS